MNLKRDFALSSISIALGGALLLRNHPEAWQVPANLLGTFHLCLGAMYLGHGLLGSKVDSVVNQGFNHETDPLLSSNGPENP